MLVPGHAAGGAGGATNMMEIGATNIGPGV